MVKRLVLLVSCFLLLLRFGESQTIHKLPQDYFINPLNIDLKLSGTFGELRSNHFHSGLDIKTNQRTGLDVLAAANGYVSRIKIERYGYGKALYITHPNGYTTVYAHLKKFSDRIEAYIKKQQYKKESYEIQLFPDDLALRVDQGELVAYSGNSGGSGGPHLHFEIRNGSAQPMNPMLFGIEIADTRRPLVKQMMAYPLNDNATVNGKKVPQPLRVIPLKNGSFKVEKFRAYGDIGIGVNTSDKQNAANNQNGVYHIETTFNGTKNFEVQFDKYSFKESRHINQMIDYGFFKETKSRISRLYIPNNSPLSLYRNTLNDGILQLYQSGASHSYQIKIKDFKENISTINLVIDNDEPPVDEAIAGDGNLTYVSSNATFNESYDAFNLRIPANALYEDALLDISQNGDTLTVHNDRTPLHKSMTISYDLSNKMADNTRQYYLGRVTSWGAVYYTSTKHKDNKLIVNTRTMGKYAVSKDVKPPTIKAVNFKNKQWISKNKTLKLSIADKQSGVKGYRATVNGKFILMEYDYKTKRLTHDFNDGVVTDTENKLKVIVTDNVGNSTTFEATFYRK